MNNELGTILPLIITFIEMIIICFYFVCFLGEKYNRKSVYLLALLLFFLTNSFFSVYEPGTIWITVLSYLFYFMYSILLFSGTILHRLFAAALFIAYATISETVSLFFISWLFDFPCPTIPAMDKMYFIAAFGSKMLLLFVILFITKAKRAKLVKIPLTRLTLLLIVVLICTLISVANTILATKQRIPILPIQLLAEIGVFILSVLVFYIYERLIDMSKKELHAELLTKQLEQDIRYFKHMDSYLGEIRGLKHDFTSHLTSMSLLLSKGEYFEMSNYINKYLCNVQSVISEIVTGLPSVDVTISFKKAIAIQNGIEFCVRTENITNIMINPVHFNIILSNLFDNAIQACIKLPDMAIRKVNVLLKIEYDYLYIKVVNSSKPVYFAEGYLPVTTKRDKKHHGLGLETISRLVHLYDGILYCEYSNDKFTFTARFKNMDNLHNTSI